MELLLLLFGACRSPVPKEVVPEIVAPFPGPLLDSLLSEAGTGEPARERTAEKLIVVAVNKYFIRKEELYDALLKFRSLFMNIDIIMNKTRS